MCWILICAFIKSVAFFLFKNQVKFIQELYNKQSLILKSQYNKRVEAFTIVISTEA